MSEIKFNQEAECKCPERFSIYVGGLFVGHAPDCPSVLHKVKRMLEEGQHPERIMVRKEIVSYYDFSVAV